MADGALCDEPRAALLVALRTLRGRHRVSKPQDPGDGQQDRQEDHVDGDLGDVLELRGQPGDQAVDEVLHRLCEHHASPSVRATSYRRGGPPGSFEGTAGGIIPGRRLIRWRGEREPSDVVFIAAVDRRVDVRVRRLQQQEVVVSVRDMEDARDRELLGRVRAGDPEGAAFRELFRRNAAVAKSVALRVTRSDQLAEEAVQEGFLQLWRAPERFDEERATVRRWLLTMVHARAVDLVRREQAQRRRTEEVAAERAVVADPADDVIAAVARPGEAASVRAALASLPEAQRQVIELMYFRGVSQTGVADALGLPLGTVKSRALLAMRKLRTVLVETER